MSCEETIAIIPARGGSKGVPRKNLRLLGGKPLVAWSIEQALASGVVDRVVVSTEDEEIAAVARQWGAQVPFLRPAELARDASIVGDAISYTVQRLVNSGDKIWATLVLYPTHPFRSRRMFCAAQQAMQDGHRLFSTVCPAGREDEFHVLRGDRLEPLFRNLEGLDRGMFSRPLGLLSASRFGQYTGTSYVYKVTDPAQLIDLDTEEDFLLAERILQQELYSFENH